MTRCHTLCSILFALLMLISTTGWSQTASAQIAVLDSFNPSNTGGLCSIAFDQTSENVWVHGCSASTIESYSTTGDFLSSIERPGESANDVDIEFAPEELTLGDTTIPEGTLLFINGESGPAEIYAIDKETGTVIDTLSTSFGNSHVVGGAYHPNRNTFFLVQDRVPGPADENRIAEIDAASGAVLNTFQVTENFSVNFGDIDVCSATGNLFVVSSDESDTAEFTPDGDFVERHPLPEGVSSLSGIALNCAADEAWVAGGVVWRLDGGGVLPVELSLFEAVADGGNVVLQWQTASETGNAGFAVEHRRAEEGDASEDAWQELAFLASKAPGGTSTEALRYAHRAEGLAYGRHLFRLKQVDIDGTESLSAERAVEITLAEAFALSAPAPNPFRRSATFTLAVKEAQEVQARVYDVLGRRVAVLHEGPMAAGQAHRLRLEAGGLVSGLYLVRITGERFAPQTRRVVLMR